MGASAVVILGTGILGRWLGWLGGATAVVAIVGSASVVESDPQGPFSLLGSLGWIGLFV